MLGGGGSPNHQFNFHDPERICPFVLIISLGNWCTIINTIKKALIIHEDNTKKITGVSVVLYVVENHVHLHKI